MELSERQIKQIVRVIMPELYEMQASQNRRKKFFTDKINEPLREDQQLQWKH